MARKTSVYTETTVWQIIRNKSARLADQTRKELHKAFEQFGLKITAQSNLHMLNFLYVTFGIPLDLKHLNFRFFCLFYIISTQTIYVTQKLHTLSRFVTLRVISNVFSSFFDTPCNVYIFILMSSTTAFMVYTVM